MGALMIRALLLGVHVGAHDYSSSKMTSEEGSFHSPRKPYTPYIIQEYNIPSKIQGSQIYSKVYVPAFRGIGLAGIQT